jgi:hypothetical protein
MRKDAPEGSASSRRSTMVITACAAKSATVTGDESALDILENALVWTVDVTLQAARTAVLAAASRRIISEASFPLEFMRLRSKMLGDSGKI